MMLLLKIDVLLAHAFSVSAQGQHTALSYLLNICWGELCVLKKGLPKTGVRVVKCSSDLL